ncbi:helix-turn-helix domain-containing protein [Ancylobacter sp. SL191]|uniref:helix-turn-helix domain-containing protein n=1 Tax=Ancylobacter sp. SL191 TaxID=2995166 RepID=UPI002270B080|nr:AraC family transcriptional regulator [Ancylobacter sp. SL191]WAC29602.1 AraC family transcriptional regulator [Ancylobacter sp. SL191]
MRVDISISEMVAGNAPIAGEHGSSIESTTNVVQDGLELFYWNGRFEEQREFPLLDDRDRLYFCFNSCISGGARCLFEDGTQREYEICGNGGRVQYGPGRKGLYQQRGEIQSIAVMVQPDLFAAWTQHGSARFLRRLADTGIIDGYRGGELLAMAQLLRHVATQGGGAAPSVSRHSLWLQAQCMAFVSLFLEPLQPPAQSGLGTSDQHRLFRARDRLLADLSQAPSLDELAKEVGLSVPTLTRGFRRLFAASPFALFQRERMEAARVRLTNDRDSVMRIAADLGYTNASHFADAFRRQFGFLPGEIRRQTRKRPAGERDASTPPTSTRAPQRPTSG